MRLTARKEREDHYGRYVNVTLLFKQGNGGTRYMAGKSSVVS
jgi:hypothetical protein